MSHEELKQTALENPEVRAEYEAIGQSYYLLKEMISARLAAGLTQAQIAERMGVKRSAVSRLESMLMSGQHSPTMATLEKYAQAMGYTLQIKLVKDE
jgi:transcriptional regulator with XRE-family HTH domain